MSRCEPPRLVSDEGCCWFHDSCRKAHLIWFDQQDEWDWEVSFEHTPCDWHPIRRWVAAHGPQLAQMRSWANWECKNDGDGGFVWRLRFVMAAEEEFADAEHEVFGYVSNDGSEIVFEDWAVWSRAGDLLRWVSNQALGRLWDQYTVQPLPCGGHAPEAAQRIREHGFVILMNVLSNEQVIDLLRACQEMEQDFLQLDRHCHGQRGPGRYSFGQAHRNHWMTPCEARSEWTNVIALPAVACVLHELLGPDALCVSMGGDCVLPGTALPQALHSDLFSWPEASDDSNFGGRPPFISVNFTVKPIYARDGPIRMLPGTHRHTWNQEVAWENLPSLQTAGLAPLMPGAAIIRDVRTWHGGTPNLGWQSRYLPSCEYVPPQYLDVLDARARLVNDSWNGQEYKPRAEMPPELFDTLCPVGQRLCRHLVQQ